MRFEPVVPNPEVELLDATVSELKARATAYVPSSCGSTGGDNAVYGFTSTKEIKSFAHPCHAFMGGAPIDKTAHVWSVFCKPNELQLDPAILRDHFDWLVDKEVSPWRSLLAIEPPQKSGRAALNNPDFMWEYGFVFSNIKSMPANLLMNFFVASRMAKEWPTAIAGWHALVTEHGCDPALAYVALRLFAHKKDGGYDYQDSNIVGTQKKGMFRLNTANWYDWPLDTASATVEYIENFVNGLPVNAEKDGFACGRHQRAYRKINNCWGPEKSIGHTENYQTFLFNTYGSDKGTQVMKKAGLSGLAGTSQSQWALTHEDIVVILHAEAERISQQNACSRQTA